MMLGVGALGAYSVTGGVKDLNKLNKLAKQAGLKNIDELNDVLKYTGMSSDELANAFKNGKTLDSILGLSEANMSYLMQKTGKTADEIATLLAKNEIDLSNINGNNVDDVKKDYIYR